MKKTSFVFAILFFLCCFEFSTQGFCSAASFEISNYKYSFECDGEVFNFETKQLKNKMSVSSIQKELFKQHNNRFEILEKIKSFGLSENEEIEYAFPETKIIVDFFSEKFGKKPKISDIQVRLNCCEISF